MNTPRRFFLFPMGLLLIAGVSAIVMLLWNWLAPDIFGLSTISFWQALGLLILSRLLFGGFGRGWAGKMAAREHPRSDRNPIREKWMKMTPEERKSFAQRWHHRHDFFNRKMYDDDHFDMNDQPKKENE